MARPSTATRLRRLLDPNHGYENDIQALHDTITDLELQVTDLADCLREVILATLGLEMREGIDSENLTRACALLGRSFPLPEVIDAEADLFPDLGA